MADSKVTKSKKTTKLAEAKQNAKLAKRSTADLLNDLRSSSQAQLNNALIEAKADLKKAFPCKESFKKNRQKTQEDRSKPPTTAL